MDDIVAIALFRKLRTLFRGTPESFYFKRTKRRILVYAITPYPGYFEYYDGFDHEMVGVITESDNGFYTFRECGRASMKDF